jgi:NTE family protein
MAQCVAVPYESVDMDESDQRLAVALGSGVARGWAHIGVLRGLERAGVKPAFICGTSIGALIGGVYLAGRLDELELWARQLNRFRVSRLFDFQLGRGGLIAGQRFLQILHPDLAEQRIEDLPAQFAGVSTELGTGHEVWLQKGNLLAAMRASYALPGLFPPVRIDGRWLLDGALVNPVPVSVCRALGARVVAAVNLNADAFGSPTVDEDDEIGLGTTPQGAAHALAALPGTAIVRQLFSRRSEEPSLFAVMASSLNIVQDRLTRSRLAGDPPDVTIAPKVGHIGLMEFERAGESISAGEQAVEQALPALKEALRRLRN